MTVAKARQALLRFFLLAAAGQLLFVDDPHFRLEWITFIIVFLGMAFLIRKPVRGMLGRFGPIVLIGLAIGTALPPYSAEPEPVHLVVFTANTLCTIIAAYWLVRISWTGKSEERAE